MVSDQPQHDLRVFGKVRSPCDDGETAVDNGVPATVNGCGSADWQVKLGKVFAPYLHSFTPCCNAHDACFDHCGGPDFSAAFKTCNNDFKTCMYDACADLGYIKKKLCKSNAYSFYKLVASAGGKTAYEKAQKNHCDCKAE